MLLESQLTGSHGRTAGFGDNIFQLSMEVLREQMSFLLEQGLYDSAELLVGSFFTLVFCFSVCQSSHCW
jgi:hypothetical protein